MAPADQPVFLITGASSGIGEATARRAVAEGYRVVLGARSEDKLRTLAAELGDDRALAQRCDVSDWDDQQALVSAALARFGRLDVYFANAGFGAPRGFLKDDVEHWHSMIDTNVLGVALSIRAGLPPMLDAGGGMFVITSSVAGRRALPGSLYAATKWAVTAMGEALRQEIRKDHPDVPIRVTLIEPGMVDTPFFDNRPRSALEADDIARAVIYAVSQPPHVDVNEMLIRPTAQPN